MQNRYVGDIGDYVKLAILRALAPDRHLGVAWWLVADEQHNDDGRHIDYLDNPAIWRRFDPVLFDALSAIVKAGRRHVSALEDPEILPGCLYDSEVLPSRATPHRDRPAMRKEWFEGTKTKLADCNFVFLDPDNGVEPPGFRPMRRSAGKSVALAEVAGLNQLGRVLVVYHHHTRRAGGHHAELGYQADRLRGVGFLTVDALRARPYSPRAFFILNADAVVRDRAQAIASKWSGAITWHPEPTAGLQF